MRKKIVIMEIKRKYTDEPGADKGAIHLMINRFCGNSCPLCCNNQYDLDTVPVVTVEELKAAHTVMLTGGDPFYVKSLMDILAHLRYEYHNIEYVYIYTSGFPMFKNEDILRYPEQFFSGVNGINFSPKSISDYAVIREILSNPQYIFQFSARRCSRRSSAFAWSARRNCTGSESPCPRSEASGTREALCPSRAFWRSALQRVWSDTAA